MYLLTFAALALLALTLAYWTWPVAAPRPVARAAAPVEPAGHAASAGGLFGTLPRSRGASPTGLAIKLLGLVASPRHQDAYAVMQLDAKDFRAVKEGGDIAPGIRLAEVHADHVVLERNGVRETLAWPEKKGTTAAPTNRAATPAAPAPTPATPAAAVPSTAPGPTPPPRGGRGSEE